MRRARRCHADRDHRDKPVMTRRAATAFVATRIPGHSNPRNRPEAPMIRPRRIGHATFETPDLERAIAYYTQTMGLVLAAREKDRAFLASKIGLLTIALQQSSAQRCSKLSFEVAPDEDFGELGRELAR